jgi:LuxR family maltose regulon positive regulatory protein
MQRLEDGLAAGRPLTLISAPAGYGKSTLISEWTSRSELLVTWLALEEVDDDPLRFFTYFIAALQRVDASLGGDVLTLLLAGQLPPQEVIITTLANDLIRVKQNFVCVLDDFQTIQDQSIHSVLNALLTHQPGCLHLVIITREDPPFPLARMRARNQLTEVRAADLRFNREEMNRFLKDVMGLVLSETDITLLQERTEGWIAGLQLAGLSLQGRTDPSAFVESLSGSHRFILGYLAEEVLKSQPLQVQEFLLQTALLSRLTGSLCDAVTGQTDGAVQLEKLLAANLFLIPLDDEQRWYRYHHLFADLLRIQLQRTNPECVTELHLRAGYWYKDHHQPAESIEHLLAAGDYSQVVNVLEEEIWSLLNQGFVRKIEGWMQILPLEWRTHGPRISLGFAWMHLLRGNFGQIAPYLKQAEASLLNLNPSSQESSSLQAECLALHANLMQAQGKIPEALEAARHALQLLKADNFRVAGLAYLGLGAAHRQVPDYEKAVDALQNAIRTSRISGDLVTGMLAVAHITLMSLQHGRLRFAADTALQAIDWLERSETAPPPLAGAIYGALGLIYYEWNQVEKAREYLLRGIKLSTFSGHNASLIYTKTSLARLQQTENNLEEALKNIHEAEELLQFGAPDWVRPGLLYRQVGLLLAMGNSPEAEMLLRQSGITLKDAVNHQTEETHLAYLRFLLHQANGRTLQEGLELAERIIASAQSGQRRGIYIQALILGALLQNTSGDSSAGLDWLEKALEMSESEGCIRVFVEEGAALAALLGKIHHSSYATKLLALFPISAEAHKPVPGEDSLIEPLTERELEVLRLLATGLKYTEMANQLVVSVNTVRFHIKRIYAKLGVEKQAKAIEMARQLGLI